MLDNSNFDKFPEVTVHGHEGSIGWPEIIEEIKIKSGAIKAPRKIIVVECYHGVVIDPFIQQIKTGFPSVHYG